MRDIKVKLIIYVIISCFLFNVGSVCATSLNSQKSSINRNISNTKKKLNSTVKQKKSVINQIQDLEVNLERIVNQLSNIEDELKLEEEKIKLENVKLEEENKKKDEYYENLKKRLVYMYKNSDSTYLESMLSSKNFNDLYNRSYYIKKIVENDKRAIDRFNDNCKKIEKTKEQIEKSKLAVQLLKSEQMNKKHAIEVSKVRKGTMLVQLSAQQKKYMDQIAELEKQSKRIEEQIKKQTQNDKRTYSGGKFAWPVPGRYRISSQYGMRKGFRLQDGSWHKASFHSGVDIPAPTGSKVIAAASGKVLTACYVRGYGYTVIINHGSGLTTLYGHNSKLLVKAGQEVKRGQQISKAGSTGYSTGPHVHFEVRKSGKHTNPIPYLKK